MKGEWCYNQNYFSKQECEKIINDCCLISAEEGTIKTDSYIDETIRRSKVRWVRETDEYRWIFEKFWKFVREANNEWFQFNISNLDYLQFTEYNDSYKGEYKDHVDTFWLTEKKHRKVSVVLQLSDQSFYQGGQLVFSDIDEYPDPVINNQGTIIAFPSFVKHRVEPVTEGQRYSLVGWFEGPHFV